MRIRIRPLVLLGAVATTVLATTTVADGAVRPEITLPTNLTSVPVRAGMTATGVDAALTDGAAIAGQVTDVDGNPVPHPTVYVVRPNGYPIVSADGDDTGNYVITSVPQSSHGFAVCVVAGASATAQYGYGSQCNGSATPWSPYTPPAPNARLVSTQAGTTQTANFELHPAGAISGTVSAAGSPGADIGDVNVQVYRPDGKKFFSTNVAPDGTYEIDGVHNGTYHVCFAPRADLSTPSNGYVPRCYRNVPWIAYDDPPSSATDVSVASNAVTTVNQSLPAAGGISGFVHSTTSGHPAVSTADITAFANGKYVNDVETNDNGSYRIANLPSGTYRVCAVRYSMNIFGPTRARAHPMRSGVSTSMRPGGLLARPNVAARGPGRCWKDVVWSGGETDPPAPGADPVSVQAGATRSGVGFQLPPLPKAPAITGRVTGPQGGPVASTQIVVFSPKGRYLASSFTGTQGNYRVQVTASDDGYFVCFFAPRPGPDIARSSTQAPIDRGLANECWKNTPWTGGAPPSHATLVKVGARQVRTGINASLGRAGAITGRVTHDGTDVGGVAVLVYDRSKTNLVGFGSTFSDGRYGVLGLTPSPTGYYVCFVPTSETDVSDNETFGYRGQCFLDRPWDGWPSAFRN